tara:strand:- start:246 stop:989 length:744 start_codon:yes stop_codon:yes gene_type:complete
MAIAQSKIHHNSDYTVALFGPDHSPQEIRTEAISLGADPEQICFVKSASDKNSPGFMEIHPPVFGPTNTVDHIKADATYIGPGQAAVFRTAGCLVGVEFERRSHQAVVWHGGRAAMTPQRNGPVYFNILNLCHEKLVLGIAEPELEMYLTGCIGADNFKHDHPEARGLISPFASNFPIEVAFNSYKLGTLDLKRIARFQAIEQIGIPERNIKDDGLCTASTSWLADFRTATTKEGKLARNYIVVIVH